MHMISSWLSVSVSDDGSTAVEARGVCDDVSFLKQSCMTFGEKKTSHCQAKVHQARKEIA